MSDTGTRLRHIVLFRFKPETTQAQRNEAQQALAVMRDRIPEVRALTVGPVVTEGADFDLALVVDFDDVAAYKRYGPHEAHQHAWLQVLQPLVDNVKSLQFEHTPAEP